METRFVNALLWSLFYFSVKASHLHEHFPFSAESMNFGAECWMTTSNHHLQQVCCDRGGQAHAPTTYTVNPAMQTHPALYAMVAARTDCDTLQSSCDSSCGKCSLGGMVLGLDTRPAVQCNGVCRFVCMRALTRTHGRVCDHGSNFIRLLADQ